MNPNARKTPQNPAQNPKTPPRIPEPRIQENERIQDKRIEPRIQEPQIKENPRESRCESQRENLHESPRESNFDRALSPRTTLALAALFAAIIALANFTVQFSIGGSYLTYGAVVYPFSFLLLDVVSEKYGRKTVLKILKMGILLAFLPSFFVATPSIALASICAFFVSQSLDVHFFFLFKRLFPRLWWLRNNASTIIAQFFDTMIFFSIAFLAEWGLKGVILAGLSDFSVKIFLSLANTPFFYILAVRVKGRILG